MFVFKRSKIYVISYPGLSFDIDSTSIPSIKSRFVSAGNTKDDTWFCFNKGIRIFLNLKIKEKKRTNLVEESTS